MQMPACRAVHSSACFPAVHSGASITCLVIQRLLHPFGRLRREACPPEKHDSAGQICMTQQESCKRWLPSTKIFLYRIAPHSLFVALCMSYISRTDFELAKGLTLQPFCCPVKKGAVIGLGGHEPGSACTHVHCTHTCTNPGGSACTHPGGLCEHYSLW